MNNTPPTDSQLGTVQMNLKTEKGFFQPRKVELDRWCCSGSALILLSEIMQKKQTPSLKGTRLKTKQSRVAGFLQLSSRKVFTQQWECLQSHFRSKRQRLAKNKAFLLPDLRDELYSQPLVIHSITEAGNSCRVLNGWREPDKTEIKLVTGWFSTSPNSASLCRAPP